MTGPYEHPEEGTRSSVIIKALIHSDLCYGKVKSGNVRIVDVHFQLGSRECLSGASLASTMINSRFLDLTGQMTCEDF